MSMCVKGRGGGLWVGEELVGGVWGRVEGV